MTGDDPVKVLERYGMKVGKEQQFLGVDEKKYVRGFRPPRKV
jgi:hypothetical protein